MLNSSDLRVRKTHRAITNAFYALLSEQPFETISVRQLASRAEIGQTTFYNHYQDKYALACALIEETTEQLTALFLNQCPINLVVSSYQENPDLLPHARLLSNINTAEASFQQIAIQHITCLFQRDLSRRGIKLTCALAVSQHLAVLTYSFISQLINDQALTNLPVQVNEFNQVLATLGLPGPATTTATINHQL